MFKDLSTILTELRKNFGDGVVMACRATEDFDVVIEVIVFVEQDDETYQFSVKSVMVYGSVEDWITSVVTALDNEITQKLGPANAQG
jgi:hypothetical protein